MKKDKATLNKLADMVKDSQTAMIEDKLEERSHYRITVDDEPWVTVNDALSITNEAVNLEISKALTKQKDKIKMSWSDVKEKLIEFHNLDSSDDLEKWSIDVDFGYWLVEQAIKGESK